MKIHRTGVFTIAVLALAGIFTGTANAQPIVKDAHFTLPFEANWAGTALPPGDYTLSVSSLSDGRDVLYRITFAGAGKKTTILAVRPPGPHVGERSMLVAVRSGAKYSIRALHLPNADLILTFPAPKGEQTLIAGAPELLQSVPILIAAK
jgi:hypothetical protein